MYEHATLQEAYTGALIAGKGKLLNNINLIMERSRFKTEDWVRVRFGAGTPWRRCWCVITPPDEKEYNKLQKEMNRKKSAYDRSRPPVLKGDVKFYETRKVTKKTRPIATLSDAFSAFAIYPQSKPLIDASTLIKVEGTITIHSNPSTSTEGFVFVMPEVHPAVSGFEIMLRWLFPALDTFGLYGRPGRLIADTTNPQSLMFAMPKDRRYGYLEILDVTNLILTDGSQNWKEKDWRLKMKEMTAKRMTAIANGSRVGSRYSTHGSRRSTVRHSYAGSRNRTEFSDGASVKSTPSIRWGHTPHADVGFGGIPRIDSAPVVNGTVNGGVPNQRSVSEAQGLDRFPDHLTDEGFGSAPIPPPHTTGLSRERYQNEMSSTPERTSYDEDQALDQTTPIPELQDLTKPSTPEPVAKPPAFAHGPGTLPPTKPYHSPELRRAKSRMSQATLSQMGAAPAFKALGTEVVQEGGSMEESQRGVLPDTKSNGINANLNTANEGLVTAGINSPSFERPLPPIPPSDIDSSQNRPHETSNSTSSANIPASRSSFSSHMVSVPYSMSHFQNSYDAELAQPKQQTDHAQNPSTDSSLNHRGQIRQSIQRKPLPGTNTAAFSSPDTISNYERPTDFIDQMGFDRIVPQNVDTNNAPYFMSPDFATTETRGSFERPRAGVMRTVGTGQATESVKLDISIPDFDFGPTINYARLPVLQPSGQSNSQSTGEPKISLDTTIKHNSRPSSRASITPEPPNHSRIVPWQPAVAAVIPTAERRSITPEQFVQQRAAAHRPVYAHNRSKSSTSILRSESPITFRGRNSPEITTHSRHDSGDILYQPSSRAALSTLGPAGSGDISATLSAREQEHIARVTGTPLVNVQGNRPNKTTSGLVGAIDAREREKVGLRQGINSQVAQHAMHHPAYQSQTDFRQAPSSASQGQANAYPPQYMGQFGGGYPISPGAAAFAQGGGWNPPRRMSGNEQQAQYFPQQSQQPRQAQPQARQKGYRREAY